MTTKIFLSVLLAAFAAFCGFLVIESGLFGVVLQQAAGSENRSSPEDIADEASQPQLHQDWSLRAYGGSARTVVLGAADPCTEDPETGFKFQLELTSRGAAISRATFSNGNGKGFDNRNQENLQPLQILTPAHRANQPDVLSLANTAFVFAGQSLQLDMDQLHWKAGDVQSDANGAQTVRFEATIKDELADKPVVKLTKTYTVFRGSYHLDCWVEVENLSPEQQKVWFGVTGPAGISRESLRDDTRKAVAGLLNPKTGQVGSKRVELRKFDGGKSFGEKPLAEGTAGFLWAALTNTYFTAILVPMPTEGKVFCDWMIDKKVRFYNPDGVKSSGDENLAVALQTVAMPLSPAGEAGSSSRHSFHLYIGPKDKGIFDGNELYRSLGFVETIDFLACCCPAAVIRPLAFGILVIMKWMYGFLGNYGVVIIILVFLIRIVIHPLTKKSQVSMSKLGKLGPKAEEIKKKCDGNKAEMNKQLMALYREQGVSPITSMLPMMAQMPIWIALYSAIQASIELRGAAFLPFWITDLSAPDALFRFRAVMLPLFGKLDSFNLLPILMGVAFYLQQKLMPSQTQTSTSPQMAQQQKMMMIMMPLLFPLMLYNGPSGLNLYIMASTFAGVIEQYFIRNHIREREQADEKGLVAATSKTGGKVKKKKPRPFFRNM